MTRYTVILFYILIILALGLNNSKVFSATQFLFCLGIIWHCICGYIEQRKIKSEDL